MLEKIGAIRSLASFALITMEEMAVPVDPAG
jgi:hypothetical protein